jgi:hypothetical protein
MLFGFFAGQGSIERQVSEQLDNSPRRKPWGYAVETLFVVRTPRLAPGAIVFTDSPLTFSPLTYSPTHSSD